MTRIATRAAIGVFLAAFAGCKWVAITQEGEQVRIADAQSIVDCVDKGKVTASVKASVAGVPRHAGTVQTEIETIARNRAASMGGNTIVPETPIRDGEQTFGIYACRP